MSRCCIRSVNELALRNERHFIQRIFLCLNMYWTLFKIFIYEKYLEFFNKGYM